MEKKLFLVSYEVDGKARQSVVLAESKIDAVSKIVFWDRQAPIIATWVGSDVFIIPNADDLYFNF
jgi:hypothetical protein